MSKFNLRNVNKKVFIIAVLIIAALLIVLFVDSKRSKKTKEKSQITQEGTDLLQEQEKVVKSDKVIAIDAGHGAYDPGKVGVSGILEKDINLKIALLLKEELEKKYQVVITRETDISLYKEGEGSKKTSDMKERIKLIEAPNPALAVSIHQNSFPQESVKGAQVFYYGGSQDGQKIAETIQETIKEEIADGNNRVAKANQDYYMLRKTACPFVIVECGFMSNYEEEQLLNTEEYQLKMAKAIAKGIERVIEMQESKGNEGEPELATASPDAKEGQE